MRSPLVALHTVCSLFSYAAFLVAFVSGVLFLLQERQLKRKRMGLLFHRLPSLEVLDRVNFFSLGIGFGLLTLGVGCGFLGSRILFGRWWASDPKALLTVLVWALYLSLWVTRLRAALRGRRVAWLSVVGFSVVLVAVLSAGWLLHSRHPYL